jgi:hypothetical protein
MSVIERCSTCCRWQLNFIIHPSAFILSIGIHVEELKPQLLDLFAQLREDDGDRMVPLRPACGIAEGAADEDADGFPDGGHQQFLDDWFSKALRWNRTSCYCWS